MDKWIKKNTHTVAYTYNGILLGLKKEGNLVE